MAKKQKEIEPTTAQAAEFDMLFPIVKALYEEVKELSKKKQNDNLNVNKVQMINRVLSRIKAILSYDPSVEFLDLLDQDSLPSNSDAVLIMTQYIAAMKQFHNKYYYYDAVEGDYIWHTSD